MCAGPVDTLYFEVFEWTKYAIFGRKSKTLYSMKGCTDTGVDISELRGRDRVGSFSL